MTKTETWSAVLAIGEQHKLKKAVMEELETLLAPRASGAREIITFEGVDYRYCRFTGRHWPLDKMVYQNNAQRAMGRDKGYSQVGIALWNKGQNFIKNLTDEILNAVIVGDVELQKNIVAMIKDIKAGNLGNQPAWLSQFIETKHLESIASESKLFEPTL